MASRAERRREQRSAKRTFVRRARFLPFGDPQSEVRVHEIRQRLEALLRDEDIPLEVRAMVEQDLDGVRLAQQVLASREPARSEVVN